MMLLSTLLLAGTGVSTKVGWLGDIEDDTYAAFLVAADSYNATPVTHFCATAVECGDLDSLQNCAAVVTPLTGTLLTVAAQRASECPVPLTVRGTQALVSFAPLAFKLFYAARQNAVLRRSPFPPP